MAKQSIKDYPMRWQLHHGCTSPRFLSLWFIDHHALHTATDSDSARPSGCGFDTWRARTGDSAGMDGWHSIWSLVDTEERYCCQNQFEGSVPNTEPSAPKHSSNPLVWGGQIYPTTHTFYCLRETCANLSTRLLDLNTHLLHKLSA